MANELALNPMILDTANNAAVLFDKPLKIDGMEWLNPTTAAHVVELTDKAGNLIWTTTAAGNNQGSISAGFAPGWVNGLMLTKLDSGKLSIMVG